MAILGPKMAFLDLKMAMNLFENIFIWTVSKSWASTYSLIHFEPWFLWFWSPSHTVHSKVPPPFAKEGVRKFNNFIKKMFLEFNFTTKNMWYGNLDDFFISQLDIDVGLWVSNLKSLTCSSCRYNCYSISYYYIWKPSWYFCLGGANYLLPPQIIITYSFGCIMFLVETVRKMQNVLFGSG